MPRDTEFKDVSSQVADGAAAVEDSLKGIVSAAEEADAAHQKLSRTQADALDITNAFSKAMDTYSKRANTASRSVSKLASSSRDISTVSSSMMVLAASTDAAASSLDRASSGGSNFRTSLSSVQKEGTAVLSTIRDIDKEVRGLANREVRVDVTKPPPLSDQKAAKRAKDAVDDLSKSHKTFSGEIEHATSLVELARKSMLDGERQAENYAGGLGKSAVGALAAGVAMVYLLEKVGNLVDGYLDASRALSQFNVQSELAARTTVGADYGQLKEIRGELNLTKDQAKEFYDVLRSGSQSGVVSVTGLTVAAAKLRDAFGGDPTEKLKEFVSLVESIPTLEADLAVTASMDDQAASLFALAKEGKITTLLELQSAGLLGGMDVTMSSMQDVKMLNAQQKATKVQEDIKDFLVGTLMPTIGPGLAAVSKVMVKTFVAIGAGLGLVGATNLLLGSQIAAQNATTAAVLTTGGMNRLASVSSSPGGGGALAIIKGKLVPAFGKAAAGVKSFAVGIGAAAIAATALVAVLAAASWGFKRQGESQTRLAKEYRTAGYDMRAANADVGAQYKKLGASVTGFAAAGAAIGAIAFSWTGLGAIGAGAIGVVVGGLMGLGKWLIFDLKNLKKANRAKTEAAKAEMLHTEASREFRDSMARAIQPNEKLTEAMKQTEDRFRKSSLSFQRQITALDRVAGTAKVQLSDLEKEVAGIELKNLVAFGGTMGDFNRAIDESTTATTSKFELLNRGLADRRRSIAKDAHMTNEERRIALTQLKDYELKATEEFVNGISEVIQQLLKTPGIAQAEMQRQLRGQRTDFAAETGGMSAADLRNEINEEVGAALSAMGKISEQIPKVEKLRKDRDDELKRFMEEARESGRKLFQGMSADAKKNFEDIGADLNRLSVEDFEKIGKMAAEQLEKVNEDIADLSNGLAVLEGGSVRGLRANAAGLKHEFDAVGKELDAARSKRSKGLTPGSTREKKNTEKIEELAKRKSELDDKILANEEQTAKWAKRQAEVLEETLKWEDHSVATQRAMNIAALQLSGKIEEANALRGDERVLELEQAGKIDEANALRKENLVAVQRAQAIMDGVIEAEEEAVVALNKEVDLMKKGKDLHEAAAAAAAATTKVQDTKNKDLEDQIALEGQYLDKAKALIAAAKKRKAESTQEVKIAERNLSVIEAKAEIDRSTGRGLQNILVQNEANRRIAGDILDNNTKMLEDAKANRATIVQMKVAPEGIKDAFTGMIEQVDASIAELEKESSAAEVRLWAAFNGIDDAVAAAMSGPLGKAATSALDLSGVRFEFAEFSAEAEAMMGQNVALAKVAARVRGKLERDAIQQQLREAEKQAAALTRAGKGAEATERLRAAQVEAQYKMERSKTDEVKEQLEAVKKAADFLKETVNIREEGLEAELDYLGFIGAHYSRMLDIQGNMVRLARERYEIEQDTLNDMKMAGVTGQALLRQETAVRVSWIAMQKKSVGVQKDVMEKILGSAFGQLAGDMGAIKGLNRTSNIMGIDNSRVFSAAGLAMGAAGPGGGGTIAERSIMRQLRGMRGGAPKKLTAEEKLAKAMHGTEDATVTTAENTASTAKNMAAMAVAGLSRGSLFTHDEGAHSILSSLLSVTKEIAISLLSGQAEAGEGAEAAKERIEKAITDASKESTAQSIKQQSLLDKTVGQARNMTQAVKGDADMGKQIHEKVDDANADLSKSQKALERLKSGSKLTPEESKKYDSLEEAIESLEATIKDKMQRLIGLEQTMRANVIEQPFAGAGFNGGNQDHLRILRGGANPLLKEAMDVLKKVAADKKEVLPDKAVEDRREQIQSEFFGKDWRQEDYEAYAKTKYGSVEKAQKMGHAALARLEQGVANKASEQIRDTERAGMEQRRAEFRKKHFLGTASMGRLEGKGSSSQFGSATRLEDRMVSGFGKAISAERRKGSPRAGMLGVKGGVEHGGVIAGVEPEQMAIKPSESVVSGHKSTREGIDKRTAFQARGEEAMAPTTSFAHMATTGEGSVAGGANSMKITGELFLRSDNPFVRDQMAIVVGEVLGRADVQEKFGFVVAGA